MAPSDAAREAEGRFDLHLLAPPTAAEGHAHVAASSVVADVVEMDIVKVQDGHVVHNGQLGAGMTAASALGRLHAGTVPLHPILPHDDIPRGVHFVDNVFGIIVAAKERRQGRTVVRCVAAGNASRLPLSWFDGVGDFYCNKINDADNKCNDVLMCE